jgi:hypothetical protein
MRCQHGFQLAPPHPVVVMVCGLKVEPKERHLIVGPNQALLAKSNDVTFLKKRGFQNALDDLASQGPRRYCLPRHRITLDTYTRVYMHVNSVESSVLQCQVLPRHTAPLPCSESADPCWETSRTTHTCRTEPCSQRWAEP